MAFKEQADLDASQAIKLGGIDKKTNKPNPTSIEGFYVGSRQVPSTKSKTGYTALHILNTQKGNIGVWGTTNLDSKLANVDPGLLVRVTFVGMQPTKNNPMYKYKVEVDEDQRIDVATASSENTNDDTAQDDSDYAEDESEPQDEVVPARAMAPARPAAPPSQTQQAKVAALLQRRK